MLIALLVGCGSGNRGATIESTTIAHLRLLEDDEYGDPTALREAAAIYTTINSADPLVHQLGISVSSSEACLAGRAEDGSIVVGVVLTAGNIYLRLSAGGDILSFGPDLPYDFVESDSCGYDLPSHQFYSLQNPLVPAPGKKERLERLVDVINNAGYTQRLLSAMGSETVRPPRLSKGTVCLVQESPDVSRALVYRPRGKWAEVRVGSVSGSTQFRHGRGQAPALEGVIGWPLLCAIERREAPIEPQGVGNGRAPEGQPAAPRTGAIPPNDATDASSGNSSAAGSVGAPGEEAGGVIDGDHAIGSFYVRRDGLLAGLIRSFGPPKQKRRVDDVCEATWSGLHATLYNLGGEDPCDPRYGRFLSAELRGGAWMTTEGLRIGDSVRKLRELYPRAQSVDGWYRLSPGVDLRAQVVDERVRAFDVYYPAGGD